MWCSFALNLLVVTLQKKLSSFSHEVGRKSDWWRCTHVTTSSFFFWGGRTSLLLPRLIWLLYPTVSLLCPRRGSIKRWCASDVWLSVYLFVVCLTSLWCLSVAYIGAEVAHVTRDSATTFEVKKIKGQGQRTKTRWPYHTVLKGWRYSLTFRHNINIGRSDGQTDMPCEYDIHTR